MVMTMWWEKWSWKWVVLWSLWAARVVRQPTAAVRVSGGWLRGTVAPAGTHRQYLGVPYATVTHRFQAPGPEPTWEGEYDAVEEYVVCEQALYSGSKYTQGHRECLVLNVYTPLHIPQNKSLPVMVFIHGGGFFQRSASPGVYGPEYLTSKGVLLVTLNYRLNIQGFLCLGIKEAPGNAGMKDQVAALKWVQRNIRVFGGDPDDVTLFGESAGAASVSFHVLSPMSKGLFHKAIIQSGSALASWTFQYNAVYMASLLAKTMGFNSQNPHELYNFFIDKSDTDLIIARVPRKEGNIVLSEILYVPCAEKEIEGQESFLTELPHDVLEKGTFNKIPMIIGSNVEEGLIFAGMETEPYLKNITFEKALPKDLVFPSYIERKKVADELRSLYMGDDDISQKTLYKFSRLHGDPFFVYPSLQETDMIVRSSGKPVYYYIFGYDGWRNMLKWMLPSNLRSVPGATHADELFYLFCSKFMPSFFEDKFISIMSTMWTNFAKFEFSFQAPGLEPTWTGTYEAVEENIRCVQAINDDGSGFTVGQSDCLTLNVYTPLHTSPEDNLPVMVFIHGGGFFTGSATPALYGPVYLTAKGVILVTFNYRLNVEGFLCLGIKEAPGNAGLKDQVAALKWIKKNIKAFGGDPDNVTIFGESAGGVSVSYHIVSSMSKGLFHKAIIQSGSSTTSWALQLDPVYFASLKAKLFGFQSTDPHKLYNFLNSKTETDLVTKIVPREEGNTIVSQLIFIPCVEKHVEGQEPFLTQTPYEILSSGNFNKVPLIAGFNSEEGLFFVNMDQDHFIVRHNFDISLPKNLAFSSHEQRSDIANQIRKIYLGDDELSLKNLYNVSRFLANTFIEFPVLDETDVIVRNSDAPVYNYIFNYDGRRNLAKRLRSRKELLNVTGATHADELLYLFSQQIIPSLSENDMINKMTTLWTNFAKYGDPIPTTNDQLPVKWPPVAKKENDRKLLVIDKNLRVIPQPKHPALTLWKNVYRKYRRKNISY